MIKVRKLTLKDDKPTKITLELDALTAARLCEFVGGLSGHNISQLRGASVKTAKEYAATSDLFNALSSVFNSYYDEGASEAVEKG